MRTIASVFVLLACLVTTALAATIAVDRPPAILTNWPLSNLTDAGFQVCFSTLFSATGPTLSEINTLCSGSTIAIGCRGAGSDTLVTVAFGAKTEVFANLTATPVGTVALNTTNRFYYNPTSGSTARLGYTNSSASIPVECVFAGSGPAGAFCRNLNGTQIAPGGFCGSIGVTSSDLVQMVILSAPCEGVSIGGSCSTPDGLCASLGTCLGNKTCSGSVVTPLPTLADCESSVKCNPITGGLEYKYRSFGFPCNDGDNCTINDRCPGNSGVCGSVQSVFIPAPQPCFGLGVCLSPNGTIVYPPISSGPGTVSDNNPCTQGDSCVSGVLIPGPTKVCNSSSSSCFYQVCNPNSTLGDCVNDTPKPDGTVCISTDLCALFSTCQTGLCTIVTSKNLTVGACFVNATCDPGTGTVSGTFKGVGQSCDDGDSCTNQTFCNSLRQCTGPVSLTCPSGVACLGSATPLRNANGTCSCPTNLAAYPAFGDGISCTSPNVCDQNPICISGSCVPQSTKTCSDTQCTAAGPCNNLLTGSGGCPPKANGTVCSSGLPCRGPGSCGGGQCIEEIISSPVCLTGAASHLHWALAA